MTSTCTRQTPRAVKRGRWAAKAAGVDVVTHVRDGGANRQQRRGLLRRGGPRRAPTRGALSAPGRAPGRPSPPCSSPATCGHSHPRPVPSCRARGCGRARAPRRRCAASRRSPGFEPTTWSRRERAQGRRREAWIAPEPAGAATCARGARCRFELSSAGSQQPVGVAWRGGDQPQPPTSREIGTLSARARPESPSWPRPDVRLRFWCSGPVPRPPRARVAFLPQICVPHRSS